MEITELYQAWVTASPFPKFMTVFWPSLIILLLLIGAWVESKINIYHVRGGKDE